MSFLFKAAPIFLIKVYQTMISPLLGPRCRFFPRCSDYMKQAIEKHGVSKGVRVGALRISKCHPYNAGGVDLMEVA